MAQANAQQQGEIAETENLRLETQSKGHRSWCVRLIWLGFCFTLAALISLDENNLAHVLAFSYVLLGFLFGAWWHLDEGLRRGQDSLSYTIWNVMPVQGLVILFWPVSVPLYLFASLGMRSAGKTLLANAAKFTIVGFIVFAIFQLAAS